MPAGRPSDYSATVAALICSYLRKGMGISEMCEADNLLPCPATIYNWLGEHPEFLEQYTRAREIQAHYVVDKGYNDAMKETDAAIGQLRLKAAQWYSTALNGKYYGSKTTQTIQNPDGSALEPTRVEIVWAKPKGEE